MTDYEGDRSNSPIDQGLRGRMRKESVDHGGGFRMQGFIIRPIYDLSQKARSWAGTHRGFCSSTEPDQTFAKGGTGLRRL